MKTLAVTLLLSAGFVLAACGGSDSNSSPSERTPSPAAQLNVIAFGAVDANDSNGLYLVRANGKEPQLLSSELQPVSFPRWSSDGSRIAYIVGGGRGLGTVASIRMYDFDGGGVTTINDQVLAGGDEAPMAWSPDGKRLAFIQATSTGGMLRIYDFDKRELQEKPNVAATSVAWSSKDDLAIVQPFEDGASTDIGTLSPDDDKATPFIAQEGEEGSPAWSPDGNSLTFWGGTFELTSRTLYIVADGSSSAKGIGPGLDATWSRDEHIAYSRPEVPGTRGDLDIYIADGKSEPRRLTRAVTLDRWPSWSSSGDTVVFLGSADAATTFLCVAALNGEDNACFDLPGLTPGAPAWSPF